MQCRFACSIAWIALAIAGIQAAPVRPLYEPPQPPMQANLDLRGTTWTGQDHVPNYRITFEQDGTVTYGYNKRSNRGGSWTLQGNIVYFEVNKKYREFRGTVTGDVLHGDSWNVTGKKWQTLLRREK